MDREDRTAPPTERRRRQAQEQGRGPRSDDLSLACRMLGAALGLQLCGANLIQSLADLLIGGIQSPVSAGLKLEQAVEQVTSSSLAVGLNLGGLVSLVCVAGLLGRLAQVGFRFDAAEVLPDVTRLNPGQGTARMVQTENGARALLTFVKIVLLAVVCGWFAWSRRYHLVAPAELDFASNAVALGSLCMSMLWLIVFVQCVVGLIDYGWRYWRFEQSLRMTPAELREEP